MLEVQNLYAGYGNFDVLKNISFSLDYGNNLCLLGANGCGKTTLIRCLSALINYKGTIKIDNQDIKTFKRHELADKIAVMGQLNNIYFSYTVYETVMMGRYQKLKKNSSFSNFFNNAPRSQDIEYIEHCLEIVGLKDLKDRQITTLSGGQLQRVYLAHTLAQEPSIILLDEPTNHLDLKHQVELISYLNKWGLEKNHSVIGVFHDINLALYLSENVLFLDNGLSKGYGNFFDIATKNLLNSIYNMDVANYMLSSYKKWEKLK